MKIDNIDISILEILSENSRLSMRELGKQINLSAPSVTERVKRMESFGIIEGYTLRINRKKLGLKIECIIEVTVKNGDYNRFKEYIENCSMVVFCVRIAGRACYFVKLSVFDLEEVEYFINNIAPYCTACTHIIFSEIPVSNTIKKQYDRMELT